MKPLYVGLIVVGVVAIAIGLGVGLGVGLSSSYYEEVAAPSLLQDDDKSATGQYRYAAVAVDAGICSSVGTEIMARHGGSAVDAAIAAAFCAGAVNGHAAGIGGGFIMTLYERPNDDTQHEFRSVIARDTAPLDSHKDMFENDTSSKHSGPLSILVPGELNGYHLAWQRYGRLSWRELIDPTIKLCYEGWNVTETMAIAIEGSADVILDDPSLREAFAKEDGTLYEAGDWMTQPRLGGTLEVIADEGAKAFYNGSLTDDIVADLQERGSIIRHDDLLSHTALLEDVMERGMSSGGFKFYSSPPPSGGLITQFIMKIMDGYDYYGQNLDELDDNVLFHHRVVESWKFGIAHRPKFAEEEFAGEDEIYWMDKLKDDVYAEEIRAKIQDDTTLDYDDYFPVDPSIITDDKGTVHVEVFSPEGSAVSLSTTHGHNFGSKVRGSRTGVIFNNNMNSFNLPHQTDESSNYIEPRKRPRTSTSPILVFDSNDKPHLQIGATGGVRILTATPYVSMMNTWFGMNISDAVDLPRIHNQLEAEDTLYYEEGFSQDVLNGLQEKGHDNQQPSETNYQYLASIQAISTSYCNICGERCTDDCIHAVCDYRIGGYPDGY